MEYQTIEHIFAPVYDWNSRILILGSLPSVKSRENNFYYGHPQNRFWRVLATVFGDDNEAILSIEQKKRFLHENHIALWDVIARCDIAGSSDSSIRNVVPNDINLILDKASIEVVYVNGGKAYELYMKYCYPVCGREAVKLPSTSPANAAWSLDRLIQEWKTIRG